MMLALGITRVDVAAYVDALFLVYIFLIFIYILLNLLFSFGLRLPYSEQLITIPAMQLNI